jgi:hypothetical protein
MSSPIYASLDANLRQIRWVRLMGDGIICNLSIASLDALNGMPSYQAFSYVCGGPNNT